MTTVARTRNDPLPDSVSLYLESVGSHELLTAEQEIELAQVIEAGEEARARLDERVDDAMEKARLRRRSSQSSASSRAVACRRKTTSPSSKARFLVRWRRRVSLSRRSAARLWEYRFLSN